VAYIQKKRIGLKQLTCELSIVRSCSLVYNVFLEKLVFFPLIFIMCFQYPN